MQINATIPKSVESYMEFDIWMLNINPQQAKREFYGPGYYLLK